MSKAERRYIEGLLEAISWLEHPFTSALTPERELRQRIDFMLAGVRRAEEEFGGARLAKTDGLNQAEPPSGEPNNPDTGGGG